TNREAAQYQPGDSDQNTRGKNIGGEIEEIPCPTSGMNGKEPLEHVDQVDEKIKNKTVEDKRVQQRNHRPLFKNRLLRQHDPNRPLDACCEVIETLIGLAARNRLVNRVKLAAAVVKRAEGEEEDRK